MKKRCDNIFKSITKVGDVRRDFYWSGNSDCQRSKENYNIILSILDEYSSSTQISLNELLEIIFCNDNLFDYQRISATYYIFHLIETGYPHSVLLCHSEVQVEYFSVSSNVQRILKKRSSDEIFFIELFAKRLIWFTKR